MPDEAGLKRADETHLTRSGGGESVSAAPLTARMIQVHIGAVPRYEFRNPDYLRVK